MAASPYRAILWDNDGVLVDTERWYHQATREVLADVGIEVTPAVYRQYFLASCGGITELCALRALNEADIAALRRRRDARYEEYLATQSLVVRGVKETLEALRPHFVMGIVTSSRRDHFELIHRRTGFLPYFDFTVAQGDYVNSKPAPDPYLAGIQRTGCSAAQCVAIEDAPRGLAAAQAAGLDCWIVQTELNHDESFAGAARVVDSVAALTALLTD